METLLLVILGGVVLIVVVLASNFGKDPSRKTTSQLKRELELHHKHMMSIPLSSPKLSKAIEAMEVVESELKRRQEEQNSKDGVETLTALHEIDAHCGTSLAETVTANEKNKLAFDEAVSRAVIGRIQPSEAAIVYASRYFLEHPGDPMNTEEMRINLSAFASAQHFKGLIGAESFGEFCATMKELGIEYLASAPTGAEKQAPLERQDTEPPVAGGTFVSLISNTFDALALHRGEFTALTVMGKEEPERFVAIFMLSCITVYSAFCSALRQSENLEFFEDMFYRMNKVFHAQCSILKDIDLCFFREKCEEHEHQTFSPLSEEEWAATQYYLKGALGVDISLGANSDEDYRRLYNEVWSRNTGLARQWLDLHRPN